MMRVAARKICGQRGRAQRKFRDQRALLRERVRQITIGSRIDFIQTGSYHGNTAALIVSPVDSLATQCAAMRGGIDAMRHAADDAQPCIAQ